MNVKMWKCCQYQIPISNWKLATLILATLATMATFAKTFDVDISTGRPAASNEAYYHGETIEFRAVRGRSVVTNVEYSCVYYQTNGMDSVWWHTDGLVFHPTNDVGAASYRFFLEGREIVGSGGVESGGVDSPTPSLTHSPTTSRDWHANGLLRLLPSPGFTPNTIELPVARLDFAAVEVFNAPYYTKSETDAKIVELAPAPGNYAVVSNRAMHAVTTNTLGEATIKGLTVQTYDGIRVHWYPGDDYWLDMGADVSRYSERGTWGFIYGYGDHEEDNVFEWWVLPNGGGVLATTDDISGKQDNLPYPTNAIPYAAITGTPTIPTVPTSQINAATTTNALQDATLESHASQLSQLSQSLDGKVPTSRTINGKALTSNISLSASEVGATTAEDVYRIVAGTNVVLVVTNYNSAVHVPAMKLQHLDPDTGEYITYWDETCRHGITLTNAMNYADAVAQTRAPAAWCGTTSGLGQEAPAGVTWVSTPETVIAGGYEYEKVITTSGAVWILTSNGLAVGATTNSYFRVSATDGTELFSIEKTDSYLVGVNADGITRSGNTITIPINVVANTHPYIRATTNLVNAVWTKEDENGFTCPFASVSWGGTSGAYVATVTCSQPQAFFYFEFMHEGTAKIRQNAKTELTGGIYFNGNTYMPTVSGNELKFIRQ